MKLKILLFIVLFSLISFISAYTAPVYTSVNLSLASSYIAPVYTSVNLSLSETEDTIYPSFSNYQDNNKTLINSGIGLFNVSVLNTNGSVYLHINNTDKVAIIQPAIWCNQILANVSTSCGGLNTGSYWTSFNSTDLTDPNAWFDGNDSTVTYYSGVDWKYFYANFSVPTTAVNGTIVTLHWNIPENDLKYNFTISESSWNYSLITGNLSIRVGTNRSDNNCKFESMNSTGWDKFPGGTTSCGNGGVFGLFGIIAIWNISNNYNASYNFTDPGVYPYYWYSYGNGTSYLYGSSTTRSYTVLSGATNTCSCATGNWNVNLADYCVITSPCNIRPGNLSFYGSGNFTCNSNINVTNLNKSGLSGGVMFIKQNCSLYV